MLSSDRLTEALQALGQRLEDLGQPLEVVVIGGGALLLLGLTARPTTDIDVLAVVEHGAYVKGRPLPPALQQAARDIAELLELKRDWLNEGPTDLLDFGLPEGFSSRAHRQIFGGLTLHVASREDQIAFKLYAATDHGPQSKHFVDLTQLRPAPDELQRAAQWARTHDTSSGFADQLEQALARLLGEYAASGSGEGDAGDV